MKVTVCELPNDSAGLRAQWQELTRHTRRVKSDLVVLPEMAFYPWLAASEQASPKRWSQAVEAHRRWLARLSELCAATVIGTRPVIRRGLAHNEGFVWTAQRGAVPGHMKYYLPNEPGYWEASWYRPGPRSFNIIKRRGIAYGLLICTELWFSRHARRYGRQGAHFIVCPRVTPAASTDKWIAGGRAAAVVSGAFCVSSNLSGPNIFGSDFGGTGWIIEPEEGALLGTTSAGEPFLTIQIDPGWAEAAKHTYPRYIDD